MIQIDILNWYEASLSPGERKVRGHFSTPPQLVEQILDACGYLPDRDLSCIRVLDPACGSGNFLGAVTRRLAASREQRGTGQRVLLRSVQRNIWGFDTDPIACFLAETQVRMALMQSSIPVRKQHFHIHQADGLAFPWEQGETVDLFLANPPYLAAKNNDLSIYRSTHKKGQADSYLLFLELALQTVRPDGWIGLVLPDPVLARTNATLARQRLLKETTVHHLWHLSGVFAAYVGATVLIAQKRAPARTHQIAWIRGQSSYAAEPKDAAAMQKQGQVSQAFLSIQPAAELRYLLSDRTDELVHRLHTDFCLAANTGRPASLQPLSELVSVRRGEELGKGSPVLQHKLSNRHKEYPVLRGGVDVRPYEIPVGQCWIARERVVKPLERYLSPKLLIVKSTGRLQATLDLQGHIVLQTLYLLNLRLAAANALDELYFLLALLNSRLLREYVYVLSTAYKWVQPQIEQHVLAQLPIPMTNRELRLQVSKRAKLLMHACSPETAVVELKEQEIYEEQERDICKLYATALEEGRLRLSSLSFSVG
ncbi:hypothetical protein EPA93_26135 [Ktedonosporobacter rubrisoli]|uniref:site-specific DNA-methyltransferase (adenine-specific) n=1 Tax=Ktedonosporobacter rubrisoli TaxID=2509675 RepID=A0A4P6JW99_KTERU|nr:N-6 DNA methylase [Ktedonosporobacter rubrisoli]QBD79276.1 hypothetical protein EPA93_26135 [Ktedonosporobacter rubrisoli]